MTILRIFSFDLLVLTIKVPNKSVNTYALKKSGANDATTKRKISAFGTSAVVIAINRIP